MKIDKSKVTEVKNLPKNVVIGRGNMPDATYIILQSKSRRKRSPSSYEWLPALKAGTLVISTEGGHLYTFQPNGNGLKGMGKLRFGALDGVLLQQVSITSIEIGDYRAPPVRKKVSKKKVTKKTNKRRL